ncbi:DUF4159 domain-containing protein [Aureibaculum conchae]|uniref:DUF4159 domain-containing protein n=1 Tax=Aureibaculum sp. 2308TA14-22 TaxID=3108392 RepID=UPI0033965F97
MYRFLFFLLFLCASAHSQEVAILKYKGGGDWYANPTAVPNLIEFCNTNINTIITEKPETVDANSLDIFNYPILFMTGHGNVFFDDNDVQNLRNYLSSGGFLHISDNYGLDKFVRTELEKLFPESELQEIPYNHAIYNQTYKFESLPKIHEHDGKAPQGFGLFVEGRLVLFYDYESDLSDGWEDEAVHNNPAPKREKALQMGANIIEYVFKH